MMNCYNNEHKMTSAPLQKPVFPDVEMFHHNYLPFQNEQDLCWSSTLFLLDESPEFEQKRKEIRNSKAVKAPEYEWFESREIVLLKISQDHPDVYEELLLAALLAQSYITASALHPWALNSLNEKTFESYEVLNSGFVRSITPDKVKLNIGLSDIIQSISLPSSSSPSFSSLDSSQVEEFIDVDSEFSPGQVSPLNKHSCTILFEFADIAIKYLEEFVVPLPSSVDANLVDLEQIAFEVLSGPGMKYAKDEALMKSISCIPKQVIRTLLQELTPIFSKGGNQSRSELSAFLRSKSMEKPFGVYYSNGRWHVEGSSSKNGILNYKYLIDFVKKERPELVLYWRVRGSTAWIEQREENVLLSKWLDHVHSAISASTTAPDPIKRSSFESIDVSCSNPHIIKRIKLTVTAPLSLQSPQSQPEDPEMEVCEDEEDHLVPV